MDLARGAGDMRWGTARAPTSHLSQSLLEGRRDLANTVLSSLSGAAILLVETAVTAADATQRGEEPAQLLRDGLGAIIDDSHGRDGAWCRHVVNIVVVGGNQVVMRLFAVC